MVQECDSCLNCPARQGCESRKAREKLEQIESLIAFYNTEQGRKLVTAYRELIENLLQELQKKDRPSVIKVAESREMIKAFRIKEAQ